MHNRLLRRCGFLVGLMAGVLTFGGCGFEPLYSSDSSVESTDVMAEMGQMKISTIPNRQGVKLRNALLIRLNPQGEPSLPRYNLNVGYAQIRQDYGMRRDGTTGQRRLRMQATYTLREGNKVVYSGQSIVYSNFSVLSAEFATTMAERGAEDRGIQELAEDIRLKLAVYFKKAGNKAAP